MQEVSLHTLIKTIAEQLICYDDPELRTQSAWWMIEAITNSNKATLISKKNIQLTAEQQEQIDDWIKQQVIDHKPLQYLLTHVPFGPLNIIVRPPTLIARPETEEWTYALIEYMRARVGNAPLHILDMCTGSGCIALAFAHAFSQATVLGVDKADSALKLAQENAEHNCIENVRWLQSNLFTNIPSSQTFDLIVSNPPYISASEWQQLDRSVQQWEDYDALVAADDGLALIKEIINQATHRLKKDSIIAHNTLPQLIIEIGHLQGPAVAQLMTQAGFTQVRIEKDLQKKDRFVTGSFYHAANNSIY